VKRLDDQIKVKEQEAIEKFQKDQAKKEELKNAFNK